MQFSGERFLRKPEEAEPRSSVKVQLAYYPIDSRDKIQALREIEQSSVAFFSEDPNAQNVFLIEMPPMAGINLSHFREWVKRTGKYFEGYIQHTLTGFMKSGPLSKKELEEQREIVETGLKADTAIGEDAREQLFFFGSLVVLDRIAEKRKFTLVIEPLSRHDSISFYKRTRRLLRGIEEDAKEADRKDENRLLSPENLEEFIEEERQAITRETREEIALLDLREATFSRFLKKAIKNAAESGKDTRIFVPRGIGDLPFDQKNLSPSNQKNPRITYEQPLFINTDPNDRKLVRLITYCNNPQAEATREEILRDILTGLIWHSLDFIGSSDFKKHPDLLDDCSPEEMYQLVAEYLSNKDQDEARVTLLKFYGNKVGDKTDYEKLYYSRKTLLDNAAAFREAVAKALGPTFSAHRFPPEETRF